MRNVIPPGVTVPLHSHSDPEDYFIVSGAQQVLMETTQGMRWVEAQAGDCMRITGSALDADRDVSEKPAVDLIIATAHMGVSSATLVGHIHGDPAARHT